MNILTTDIINAILSETARVTIIDRYHETYDGGKIKYRSRGEYHNIHGPALIIKNKMIYINGLILITEMSLWYQSGKFFRDRGPTEIYKIWSNIMLFQITYTWHINNTYYHSIQKEIKISPEEFNRQMEAVGLTIY